MSEEESFVCVCVSQRESHSTVKHVPPVFSHGIRARLALERILGFRVTILQVNFGGLLVGIPMHFRSPFDTSSRAVKFSLSECNNPSHGLEDTAV